MSLSTTHIIQQQVLEIDIDKKDLASDIQDRLSVVYREKLIPLFDKIFSEFSHADERIQIDKLDLDLGKLRMDNFEEDLLTQLKPQLEEQLTKLVYKVRNNHPQSGVKLLSTRIGDSEGIKVFYHYLKTGYFPWWAKSEDRHLDKLKQLFVDLDWFSEKQKSLFFQLMENERSRKRMIDMLKPDALEEVFSKINKTLSDHVFAIQKDLVKCLSVITEDSSVRNLFTFYSFDKLVKYFFTTLSLNASVDLSIDKTSAYSTEVLLRLFEERYSQYAVEEVQLKKVNQVPQTEFKFFQKDEFIAKLKTLDFFQKEKSEDVFQTFSEKEKHEHIAQATKPTVLDENEKIEITNAGLVLVWPYIQIFFRELGLMEENKFKHEEAQWKAIHLLYFLATGNEAPEEQELLLPKLMCDYPIDAFVLTHFELSDEEKEECHHLLEILIKNWPVLKKTSVHGLRTTFIQREGMLSKDGNVWLIQIERTSLDILLERLNWSIANIKLPWNDYLIQVKW